MKFFKLPIYGETERYRERVYCYELYHQLRLIWPKEGEYTINGEVDKAAHPIIRANDLGSIKPDFIIHKPGRMDENLAIMEVKCSSASKEGIEKDLNSLSKFKQLMGYKNAIYLLYGYEAEKTAIRAIEIGRSQTDINIDIWVHSNASDKAFIIDTI